MIYRAICHRPASVGDPANREVFTMKLGRCRDLYHACQKAERKLPDGWFIFSVRPT